MAKPTADELVQVVVDAVNSAPGKRIETRALQQKLTDAGRTDAIPYIRFAKTAGRLKAEVRAVPDGRAVHEIFIP